MEKINSLQDQNQYCYFKVDLGEESNYYVVFELYNKLLPKACQNFISFCKGFSDDSGELLTYQFTKLRKFWQNGLIIGGEQKEKNKSYYGGFFEDENYQIKHDQQGILGYLNQGYRHTNAGMFYITLQKIEDLDRKMVAFGKVIKGIKVFQKINKLSDREISENQVKVIEAGILDQERMNEIFE